MSTKLICVLGGTGFVGQNLVRNLCSHGVMVRLPTRSAYTAEHTFASLPVEVISADLHDLDQLINLFHGVDAIINLVGVLHERGGETFQKVHVELPLKVIEAAKISGVSRLIHMSALNAAPDGKSSYLRTKGEAENLLRGSGLQVTLFRPSVIFGDGDSFLSLFGKLARWFPVLPLACADAKFQPVWVEDVAQALAQSLNAVASIGESFDLCGPQVYSLKKLVAFAASCCNKYPLIIPLPDKLAYLQAWLMELMPTKLMTRDNFYSMHLDSVCNCDFPFEILPTSLEEIAPQYIN